MEANLRGLNTEGWYDEEEEIAVLNPNEFNEFLTLCLFFFPHFFMIFYAAYYVLYRCNILFYRTHEE